MKGFLIHKIANISLSLSKFIKVVYFLLKSLEILQYLNVNSSTFDHFLRFLWLYENSFNIFITIS